MKVVGNIYGKGQDGKIYCSSDISCVLDTKHTIKIFINVGGYKILRWQNKKDGIVESDFSPTLHSSSGTDIRKRPLVMTENTSFDLKAPSSATRRGMTKENYTGALDGNCAIGVLDTPYAMGNAKGKGRSCIGSGRVPDFGNPTASIRRLTETECERLQGLPDGWTQYGMYPNKPTTPEEILMKRKIPAFYAIHQILSGKVHKVKISGSQRYKLCGNGVSIPPVQLIASELFKNNYSNHETNY